MVILKIGSLTLTFSPHRPSEQLNNLLDRTFTHKWPEFSSASVSVAEKKNISSIAVSPSVSSLIKDSWKTFSSAKSLQVLPVQFPMVICCCSKKLVCGYLI